MIIYKITNKKNGKIYIGQTIRSLEERWYGHCQASKRGSLLYFHLAIKKHGVKSFKIQILRKAKNQEQLNSLEKYFIKKYQSYISDIGYNGTFGGSFGKMSEVNRKKISKALKGRISSRRGIPNTEEQKRKISETKKGVPKSEETKKRLSQSLKEYYKTHENSFKGKRHTEETKRNLSNKAKKRRRLNGKVTNN